MNAGARLDEVIHTVTPPAHLMERPYLRPVYDEPEFVVRTVWRLYGGWWDGNPATLKPAPERALALELAELAGGAARPGRPGPGPAAAEAPDRDPADAGLPGRRRTLPTGRSAWPDTWPSWPGWPPPTTPECRRSGGPSSPGGPTPPRPPWPTGCSRGPPGSPAPGAAGPRLRPVVGWSWAPR